MSILNIIRKYKAKNLLMLMKEVASQRNTVIVSIFLIN